MNTSAHLLRLSCFGLIGFFCVDLLANEPDETNSRTEVETTVKKVKEPGSDAEVSFETSAEDREEREFRKDWPYLGIATTEASEALAAQLGLRDGAGLVVIFVNPDSPAAKAGLQKNDVLAKLGDQALVHPAQLRKLIHVHKKGEVIELAYYRAGKQETASITLGELPPKAALFEGAPLYEERIERFGGPPDERSLDQIIHDSLRHLNKDRRGLHQEIHRSMEEVREAIKEALRDVTNVASNLDPVRRALKEIHQSGVRVDKKATVTVRSAGKGVKSLVKTDDSGTLILVRNPRLHLTAHDKDGQLLFDGEIENTDQREKVSRDLWQRVEPLLDKMDHEEPRAE